MIEAVVALALLATATAAVAKLGRTRALLEQQADGRVAATLAAENVLAIVRAESFTAVAGAAEATARQVGQDSDCQVAVATAEFDTAGRRGIHVRVTAQQAPGPPVILHDWIWRGRPSANTSTTEDEQADDQV